MHDDDPDIAWLRRQVDQAFDEFAPPQTGQNIALVAALTTVLVFLSFLITLALTAAH